MSILIKPKPDETKEPEFQYYSFQKSDETNKTYVNGTLDFVSKYLENYAGCKASEQPILNKNDKLQLVDLQPISIQDIPHNTDINFIRHNEKHLPPGQSSGIDVGYLYFKPSWMDYDDPSRHYIRTMIHTIKE